MQRPTTTTTCLRCEHPDGVVEPQTLEPDAVYGQQEIALLDLTVSLRGALAAVGLLRERLHRQLRQQKIIEQPLTAVLSRP